MSSYRVVKGIKIQKLNEVFTVVVAVCMLVDFQSYRAQYNRSLSPGLCISFDDRSIEEWNELRPLLNKYQAKVTLFVTQFDSLTVNDIEYLHDFERDGHEIGSHGARHLLAEHFLASHTLAEYLDTEIHPSIERMRQHKFNVTSFAYPYGSMTWQRGGS